MKRHPERTCIGCRNVFKKDDVVRIIAGPAPTSSGKAAVVIDYREKLPGRAAYVCPKAECIKKALGQERLSRALRLNVEAPSADEFINALATGIEGKIKSLISMSAKAGMLAAGYSAVQDALEKGRVEVLLWAQDLSEGTRGKVTASGVSSLRQATLFTRDALGKLLNRELIGVIGIEDKGLADTIWKEVERLKDLINIRE